MSRLSSGTPRITPRSFSATIPVFSETRHPKSMGPSWPPATGCLMLRWKRLNSLARSGLTSGGGDQHHRPRNRSRDSVAPDVLTPAFVERGKDADYNRLNPDRPQVEHRANDRRSEVRCLV